MDGYEDVVVGRFRRALPPKDSQVDSFDLGGSGHLDGLPEIVRRGEQDLGDVRDGRTKSLLGQDEAKRILRRPLRRQDPRESAVVRNLDARLVRARKTRQDEARAGFGGYPEPIGVTADKRCVEG